MSSNSREEEKQIDDQGEESIQEDNADVIQDNATESAHDHDDVIQETTGEETDTESSGDEQVSTVDETYCEHIREHDEDCLIYQAVRAQWVKNKMDTSPYYFTLEQLLNIGASYLIFKGCTVIQQDSSSVLGYLTVLYGSLALNVRTMALTKDSLALKAFPYVTGATLGLMGARLFGIRNNWLTGC